jgi:hypothetical protein
MNKTTSNIELRQQGAQEWQNPGSWFHSYVALGEELMEMSSDNRSSNLRVLLVVPRRELVAPAIGFGISRQRFLSRQSHSVELSIDELETLPEGTQIRAVWPKRTRDAVFLGLDKSKSPPLILLEIDGVALSPLGAKRVQIYRVDVPTPQGTKENKNPFIEKGRPQELQKKFWSQVFPAATFFSEGTHFERQMETEIKYPDLQTILGDGKLTMRDAGRFDYLSNDKHPHFINVFEKSVKFQDLAASEITRMEQTDWVILDGNSAVSQLAASEKLYERRVLGILELANPAYQNPGFQSFLSEAGNLWLQKGQSRLGWSPPAGSYVWLWSDKNES